MTPVFLDANVPIYSAGRPHPLKGPCGRIVLLASGYPDAFVTDAEVLQEMLHRFIALRQWPEPGRLAFQRFAAVMSDRIEPVHGFDVAQAARLADEYPRLSARDLVHLAVMQRLGINQIVTADAGFDGLPEIERLDPAKVASWRERVVGEE